MYNKITDNMSLQEIPKRPVLALGVQNLRRLELDFTDQVSGLDLQSPVEVRYVVRGLLLLVEAVVR